MTVRRGKSGCYRAAPAHPELVDAFRSVRNGGPDASVFVGRNGAPITAHVVNRWISDAIAKAGLSGVATGTDVKGPGSHSLRLPAPGTGHNRA